jgi:hypothetical protein
MLTDALATFRITRFITEDYLAEPFRDAVEQRFGDESKITYLVNCPWCTSIYIGGVVVVARNLLPRVWQPVASALAMSAVASLIQTQLERD